MMDSPIRPQLLTATGSGRRSSDSNSPEFEFWMLRNPSCPEPNLLSADELFVDGVLLPLHLLHLPNNSPDPSDPQTPNSQPEPPGPQISSFQNQINPPDDSSAAHLTSSSKRWKDIFKKSDKKTKNQEKEKERKREKKSQSSSGSGSAELNINIWPFSRSRSAGNSGTRPRLFPGAPTTRKVSSAPCSRSNSAGESKSRKWPSSPGRAGVHLGRSSPVWQVRRGAAGGSASKTKTSAYSEAANRSSEKVAESRKTSTIGGGGGNNKSKAVNLNVPNMCIGYRQHLSCRSDENRSTAGEGRNSSRGANSSTNLFNLRSLFSKKVY